MKLWLFMLCIIVAFFGGYFTQSIVFAREAYMDYEPSIEGVISSENGLTPIAPTEESLPPVQGSRFSPENIVGMVTGTKSTERISPYDWIKESQIHVYQNRVVIDIADPEWAAFTNTNSMDPVLDETANAIEVVPTSADQIHIGDIVSYKDGDDTIIHRVIGKGKDEEGFFFIMKGDNNPLKDPGKVRFDQIQRLVVAIIY